MPKPSRAVSQSHSILVTDWTIDYGFGRNFLDPTQHADNGVLVVSGDLLDPHPKGVERFHGWFNLLDWSETRERDRSSDAYAGNIETSDDGLNGYFIMPWHSAGPLATALHAGIVRHLSLLADPLRYRRARVLRYLFLNVRYDELRTRPKV